MFLVVISLLFLCRSRRIAVIKTIPYVEMCFQNQLFPPLDFELRFFFIFPLIFTVQLYYVYLLHEHCFVVMLRKSLERSYVLLQYLGKLSCENESLQGCYVISTGEHLHAFRKSALPPSSGFTVNFYLYVILLIYEVSMSNL